MASYLVKKLCVCALLLCLAGCSKGLNPDMRAVGGVVTANGEPQPNIEVIFESLEGKRGSIGRTDEAGRYQLKYSSSTKGALMGQYKVTINKLAKSDEPASSGNPYAAANSREQVLVIESVEVGDGRNTHDFDIPEIKAKARR